MAFQNRQVINDHHHDEDDDDDQHDSYMMIRLDLNDNYKFPRDFKWYGDQCPECKLPLNMFWVEKGQGINNKKGGFSPQVIIKFRSLYFHNT